jgi:hypothetical protein
MTRSTCCKRTGWAVLPPLSCKIGCTILLPYIFLRFIIYSNYILRGSSVRNGLKSFVFALCSPCMIKYFWCMLRIRQNTFRSLSVYADRITCNKMHKEVFTFNNARWLWRDDISKKSNGTLHPCLGLGRTNYYIYLANWALHIMRIRRRKWHKILPNFGLIFDRNQISDPSLSH